MIDIHSHVLPMVDDGAASVEQALEMLIQAYEDGTDAIVLTPHLAYAYGFDNPNDKIKKLFSDLSYIVEQEHIPIKMYLGCEFLFSSVDTFLHHFDDITFMNDTKYLLIEFFFDVEEEEILEAIDLIIKKGYTPIVAHPERYECVKISIDVVQRGVLKGALFQMNIGSVLGRFGHTARDTVFELLDRDLIHFAGSDGHNTRTRNTRMYEAYRLVKEVYGKRKAEYIFVDCPQDMLNNTDLRKRIRYEEEY